VVVPPPPVGSAPPVVVPPPPVGSAPPEGGAPPVVVPRWGARRRWWSRRHRPWSPRRSCRPCRRCQRCHRWRGPRRWPWRRRQEVHPGAEDGARALVRRARRNEECPCEQPSFVDEPVRHDLTSPSDVSRRDCRDRPAAAPRGSRHSTLCYPSASGRQASRGMQLFRRRAMTAKPVPLRSSSLVGRTGALRPGVGAWRLGPRRPRLRSGAEARLAPESRWGRVWRARAGDRTPAATRRRRCRDRRSRTGSYRAPASPG
jgi:hypothetical protein